MNFSVPDPGGAGAGAPAMILLRGRDPLIEFPPAPHLFRRIQGLSFQVGLPGGLAPAPNAVPLSEIARVLSTALFLDRGAHPAVVQSFPLIHQILPQKWEAVVAALSQPPFSMDPNAVYSSPASAVHAIRQAIAGLVGPPPAPLVLTVADLYPLETLAANAPQWYQDIAGAGVAADAVTYGTLANATTMQLGSWCTPCGLFEHVFFGRCVAASRDPPAAPVRQAPSAAGAAVPVDRAVEGRDALQSPPVLSNSGWTCLKIPLR